MGAPVVTCSTTSQATLMTHAFSYFLFASRQELGRTKVAELLARVVSYYDIIVAREPSVMSTKGLCHDGADAAAAMSASGRSE